MAFLAAGGAPDRQDFPGSLSVRQERLVASLDLSAAFPPGLERELRDGLTHVVAVHVSVMPAAGGPPLSVWAREIEVLWDVWEERFGVSATDPEHPRGRSLQLPGWAALRDFLAEARDLDLGAAVALGDGTWVLVARVELNPVKELLERTRELIGGPRAGSRPAGGSPSVLGAMASYLLGGAEANAEARFFRSRPFRVRDGAVR